MLTNINFRKGLLFINLRVPFLKKLLPYRLERFLTLKIFPVDKEFFNKPDRIWMEQVLLPIISNAGFSKILFAGCAPYTWHYELFFNNKSTQYLTTDIEPRARIWGARKHFVCRIQDIDKHIKSDCIDMVLFNGIFGWGVNSIDDMNKSLRSMYKILKKPDGILLIGWDIGATDDPLELSVLRTHYQHVPVLGLPSRTTFEHSRHVYDIFRAILDK
jgi:hypothetical protein